MTTLDLTATVAVFRARQFERVVHDSGPWSIRFAGQEVPASRWTVGDSVIFAGHFPDVCWIDTPDLTMTLLSDGEVVGERPMSTCPPDGEFEIRWSFGTGALVSV